jgi:hypothetical protein
VESVLGACCGCDLRAVDVTCVRCGLCRQTVPNASSCAIDASCPHDVAVESRQQQQCRLRPNHAVQDVNAGSMLQAAVQRMSPPAKRVLVALSTISTPAIRAALPTAYTCSWYMSVKYMFVVHVSEGTITAC